MKFRGRKLKILIIFSLIFVVAVGLLFKFYRGFAQEWINNYLAAVWYEVFWCLFIFGFIENKKRLV